MALFDRVADLPVVVDGSDLERRERETSSDVTRVTTVVSLHGDGHTGRGEDVTYDAEDHEALLDRRGTDDATPFPITGEYTLAAFSTHLEGVDLFPGGEPAREASRRYRRWAFEAAGLDLALRQAGTDLGAALDRDYEPVRFVVSSVLGDPPSIDDVTAWLDIDPALEFKLNGSADWTADLVARLAATDRVRIVDLNGYYEGVDDPDPDLYRRVVEELPDALIEDPAITPETRPILEPGSDRVTWDAPITSVADVSDRPWTPEWLNCKPSRFGTVESMFDFLDYCEAEGIRLYGGGQYELGVGREQIHALASLFYPDAPNDVAPRGYNDPEPRAGLPTSPLSVPGDIEGFRWPSA